MARIIRVRMTVEVQDDSKVEAQYTICESRADLGETIFLLNLGLVAVQALRKCLERIAS